MATHAAERLPVLARMARDVERRGSLSRSTAILMWSTYAAHAAVTGWALLRPDQRLPICPRVARLGWPAVAGGVGLCVAAMSRFASVGEIEGTRHDELATNGVYRYSRNPQYIGYVVTLVGASVARRSLLGSLLSALVLGSYSAWIPVEEQRLSTLYGAAYQDYTRRVSRWVGRRP